MSEQHATHGTSARGGSEALCKRRRLAESLTAYAYIAPAAAVLCVFAFYPLVSVFVISFTRDWFSPHVQFVGLENYGKLLFGGEFFHSLSVTVFFAVGTIPATLVLSFLAANLLFQKLRGLGAYRTIYFLPYITSTVAAAMVWGWIFDPGAYGLANQLLQHLGLPVLKWTEDPRGVFALVGGSLGLHVPTWLAGPSLALVSVMIFSVWHSLGFCTVIFLASLTTVPTELYEAASLDGVGWWARLRHITLPLVSPTAFFLLVICTIRSFQTFNEIYIMAFGEHYASCRTVTLEIFRNFWEPNANYGYSAAVAVALFAVIMLLTVIQLRVVGRRVHY